MSVYQNMAFGLKLRKNPKAEIEKRVREASAILGLDEYLERKPKALSGGPSAQRVAVGRAIVREPACFLFDEPLSNLDAKLRVTMRSELKALHQRLKTTTVYVTHDQEEAMTLGDLVVVMANGDIQQSGTPDQVFRAPRQPFRGRFRWHAPHELPRRHPPPPGRPRRLAGIRRQPRRDHHPPNPWPPTPAPARARPQCSASAPAPSPSDPTPPLTFLSWPPSPSSSRWANRPTSV
jgi:ABC-type dipeptide/oligopeptide/nickel transport system ATPase component